jgi:hypothetical protein
VSDELLDDLGVAKQGSAGFTPPLAAGPYTLLFQDTGGAVTYTMRLVVAFSVDEVPGDFNGDLVVDGGDLFQWRANFGPNPNSDADDDGDSDGKDLLIWQNHLGNSAIAGAVPEPASATLVLALAAAAMFRRGFRGRSDRPDCRPWPRRRGSRVR